MKKKNLCKKEILVAGVSASILAMAGCGNKATETPNNKNTPPTAEYQQETTAEEKVKLDLLFSVTGCETFTATDGSEKTSVRFLIENMDPTKNDWYAHLNGKETLIAGDTEIQVYSSFINENCRYAEGVFDGKIKIDDVMYRADEYENTEWADASEGVFTDIKAVTESGNLFFFNGCGASTGKVGERIICTWLAGFTADSISESGKRLKLTTAENFKIVDAENNEINALEGATGEIKLTANEFGIEVSVDAADASVVAQDVESKGMILRHTNENGLVTDFVLVEKIVPETVEETVADTVEETSAEAEETSAETETKAD